jgi:Domain of unknown function (DUF1877)
MGMTASFASVTPTELEALKKDATNASDLLFDRVNSGDVTSGVDIDKSWAAIHFMLTGSQWGGSEPQSLPVLGGTEIGADIGYGPARYLTPEQVLAAHRVLDPIPAEELKKRFIPAKLEEADIYPSGIWLDEGMDGFEYIEHWYEQLRAFYAHAAKNGNAVLLAVV